MFEKLEITAMAQAMAAHAGDRMGLVARNVAHADTPGYRALDLPSFDEVYRAEEGGMRATRPGHLGEGFTRATEAFAVRSGAAPNGNTVSLEGEMLKAAEIRQEQDMALAIYRSASGILRSSLGRG